MMFGATPTQSGLPNQGGVKNTQAPSSLGGGHIFTGQPGRGGSPGSLSKPPRVTPMPSASSPAKPPSQVAPGPATQSAPDPGTPDTSFPIPLVASDEQAKTNALSDYGDLASGLRLGMQNAATAYGDPQLMSQWGLTASPNPNSALALAALKAQLANRTNDARMTNNGTFFSSINQFNRGQIADAQQRVDLNAYQKYQNALANFNMKMAQAAGVRDKTIDAANLDERNTAIANLPTANTATGGFQGSTSQGKHAGKPSTTGIPGPGKGGGKLSTKTGKVNVPKAGKAGRGRSSSTKVVKPGSVSVKKVGKLGKR